MKEQTTLLFFENKLSGYLDNASDIFGLDIAKFTGSKIEDIFSGETALHLRNLPCGKSEEKLGFNGGVILDAKITKSKINDYTIMIMEFESKKGLNPLGRLRTNTIFESIIDTYLPSIEEKVNSFATGRNKKAVISLKNEIQTLISKIVSLVNDSENNDIINAPESFYYTDLWEFIREIENEIRALGNISMASIPYSSFFSCIKRTHTKNLILGILTYYIANEQRPYISFFKEESNIVIRISNFPENTGVKLENNIEFTSSDIKTTMNFHNEASDCRIGFKRNVFNKTDNEFLLTFTPDKFEAIKEI